MSHYETERWRPTYSSRGEGGRKLYTFTVIWKKREIYHPGAAHMYKLFGPLEIYILHNCFGSAVSDGSRSSQVHALN